MAVQSCGGLNHTPPQPSLEESALLTPGFLTLASGTWEYRLLAHAHARTHEKAGRRGCQGRARGGPGQRAVRGVQRRHMRGTESPGLEFVWHQAGDTGSCPLSTQGLLPSLGRGDLLPS